MNAGQGFTRRVTLANLDSFAPLLKRGQRGKADTDAGDDQSTDSANRALSGDPALEKAEALFNGESIKTRIPYPRPKRGGRAPAKGARGQAPAGGRKATSRPGEVMLMRVRPRRDGKQLQISVKVHESNFMNRARTLVSAANGSRKEIGGSVTKRGEKGEALNTLHFEAPELRGMDNPVARFSWVARAVPKKAARNILQYEVFDAATSTEGKEILQKLEEGISKPPKTNLSQLSRDETVLSKRDRKRAQWYRLARVT
jgi:hypothetical protein